MVYCLGGTFVVENPTNSVIALHPRWVWFLERLRLFQVFVPRQPTDVIAWLQFVFLVVFMIFYDVKHKLCI